jgi:hypothetical protein
MLSLYRVHKVSLWWGDGASASACFASETAGLTSVTSCVGPKGVGGGGYWANVNFGSYGSLSTRETDPDRKRRLWNAGLLSHLRPESVVWNVLLYQTLNKSRLFGLTHHRFTWLTWHVCYMFRPYLGHPQACNYKNLTNEDGIRPLLLYNMS